MKQRYCCALLCNLMFVCLITDEYRNKCKLQGERRPGGGYEGLDRTEVETLRLPQQPHDYTSIGSTQTAATQDVIDGVDDSLQVRLRTWVGGMLIAFIFTFTSLYYEFHL